MLGVVAFQRTIELKLAAGDGTVIDTVASIDDHGDLIVYGHDVWAAPSAFSSAPGIDHWVVVPADVKDLVLLQLLRERFTNAEPTAEFMSWLHDHAIPHEVGSPAGERRGEARLRVKAHRRNGARGFAPSSDGPINGP